MVAANGNGTGHISMGYDAAGSARALAAFKPVSAALDWLRTKYGFGRGYTEPPSFALEKDPLAWLKMKRDPVIAKAINLRRQLVAGNEIYFEAADKESRPLVPYFEAIFERMSNFTNLRLLMTNAIMRGTQWARMLSEYQSFAVGDVPPRLWWLPMFVPVGLDQIRQDVGSRVEVSPDGKKIERPVYTWSVYDTVKSEWYTAELDQYVRMHYDDDEFTLGYGNGLWESLYIYWYAKTHIWQELMTGVGRFVRPPIHVALDVPMMNAGDGGGVGRPTPEEQADAYKEVFGKIGNGDVIVTGHEGKVAMLDMEGGAISAVMELLGYIDKTMTELILAASMPTGGGEQGSFARAAVEAGSTSSIIAYDRTRLEESLRRVVWAVWEWNREAWQSIRDPRGRLLSSMRPPKLRIGRDEGDDHLRNVQIANAMLQFVPLTAKEYYAAGGWTQPDDDDQVVSPPGTGGPIPGAGGLPINPMTGEPTTGDPLAANTAGDGFRETIRRRVQFNDATPRMMTFGEWKRQEAEKVETNNWLALDKLATQQAVARLSA